MRVTSRRPDSPRSRAAAASGDGLGRLVVVGGGAAGALAALHLVGSTRREVILVERTGRFGPGIAYGTTDTRHLLNVPAGRLSFSSESPDDFVEWLASRLPNARRDTFAPRAWYGEYLRHHLDAAAASGLLELRAGEALSAEASPDGFSVALADEARLSADTLVLALGNARNEDPLLPVDLASSSRYVGDPWAPGQLDAVDGGDVLLVGSGLTAVDVALSLSARPVRLTLLSRHGLLPQPHSDTPVAPSPPGELPTTPVELLRAIRAAIAGSDDWRSVVDGLRPRTQELWRGLGVDAQAQFMRHLGSYWNVHRHRMAPEVHERLADLQAEGRLTLLAGTIRDAQVSDDGVTVGVRTRDGRDVAVDAAHVVNCTGPAASLVDRPAPILRSLLEQGLTVADAHRIGVLTTDDGALLGASGAQVPGLFAVGPIRRGTLWESTAIPELRGQAERLAAVVAAG
ncbi:MAG TPA: FAD/NAD(P)-binding protein [Gaiellaceae bacterium]|jgi:uncharacterized NAD(P)/FAD-binding protein YdhS